MTEIQALLLLKASLESANLHGVEAMLDVIANMFLRAEALLLVINVKA